MKNYQGVFTFFQRYSHKDYCQYSFDRKIEISINKWHDENDHVGPSLYECPKCPFSNENLVKTLKSFFLNSELVYSLLMNYLINDLIDLTLSFIVFSPFVVC